MSAITEKARAISLPAVDLRRATCRVCGRSFEYISRRRPPTCKDGECLYKFHYKIDPHTWADHQPDLFDRG